MKTLIVALISVAALSATVPTATQEKEVMAAMDSWIQATAKQDVAGLEKILHDELWYSHSAGTHQTKAEVIKDVQEGRGPMGIELSDTRVRIYGNMAIVKAMEVIRNRPRDPSKSGAAPGGGAGPAPLLVINVLVKGPQGWQVVSRSATRPTPPPATTAAR
jgi:ketosteroid isomerase-like protein